MYYIIFLLQIWLQHALKSQFHITIIILYIYYIHIFIIYIEFTNIDIFSTCSNTSKKIRSSDSISENDSESNNENFSKDDGDQKNKEKKTKEVFHQLKAIK